MNLEQLQKTVKRLLLRIEYPHIATIIGLQEEIGYLSRCIMDAEIYHKPYKENLEKHCANVLFSFIDLCNSYDINISIISEKRLKEIEKKISQWEKQYGKKLKQKRDKFN